MGDRLPLNASLNCSEAGDPGDALGDIEDLDEELPPEGAPPPPPPVVEGPQVTRLKRRELLSEHHAKVAKVRHADARGAAAATQQALAESTAAAADGEVLSLPGGPRQ